MNVLFIENAGHTSAGAFHALVVLADKLKKYGVNSFVALPDRADGVGLLRENNIPYIMLRECSYTQIISLKASLSDKIKMPFKDVAVRIAATKLVQYVKDNNIDIIHENTSACYIGKYVAARTGVKHVWHIREFLEEDFDCTIWKKERAICWFNEADRVITISDAIYKKYSDLIQNDKFIKISDGVVSEDFFVENRKILDNSIINLLMVGRVCEGKGQHIIVEALGILQKKYNINMRLNIVGLCADKEREKINSIAENYGIEKYVTVHGHCEDIAGKYRENDVFCMASASEGFGLVTVEAMLSGCLVLGADSGATSEILSENAGILAKSYSAESFADKLAYIDKNRMECIEIARIGQEKALNNYGADKNAESIYKLYKDICT